MIWVRQHRAGPDTVLAMADKELMGQKFEQGELVLEITEFYKGELCSQKEAAEMAGAASIINAVGEKAISALVGAGLMDELCARRIKGIPHIQVVLVR